MVVDAFRHRHDTALRVSAWAQSLERMNSSIAFQHLQVARETRGLPHLQQPTERRFMGNGRRTWWSEDDNCSCGPPLGLSTEPSLRPTRRRTPPPKIGEARLALGQGQRLRRPLYAFSSCSQRVSLSAELRLVAQADPHRPSDWLPRTAGPPSLGIVPATGGAVRFQSNLAFFLRFSAEICVHLLVQGTPCGGAFDEFRPRMRHIGPCVPPLFRASQRPA